MHLVAHPLQEVSDRRVRIERYGIARSGGVNALGRAVDLGRERGALGAHLRQRDYLELELQSVARGQSAAELAGPSVDYEQIREIAFAEATLQPAGHHLVDRREVVRLALRRNSVLAIAALVGK